MAARAIVLPTWYAEVGSTLPPGKVVLAYPVPFSGLQSSQAWQALNTMRWAQAGGGGPEGQAGGPGRPGPASRCCSPHRSPSARRPGRPVPSLAAIRRALTIWGVTTIVVPDQAKLPIYEQGRSTAYAVGLLAATMGRRPAYSHSAWVWSDAALRGAPVVMSPKAFRHCLAGPAGIRIGSPGGSHLLIGLGALRDLPWLWMDGGPVAA